RCVSPSIGKVPSIKRFTANAPVLSEPTVMLNSSSCSIILWCATSLPCATSTPSPASSSISKLFNAPGRLMLHCCPPFHSEINSYPPPTGHWPYNLSHILPTSDGVEPFSPLQRG